MTALPDARLLNPLVVSGLLAVAVSAVAGLAVPAPEADVAATLMERLVHNPFVLGIGFAGIWALIYGLIQLCAIGNPGADGLWGWISGQARRPRRPARPTRPSPPGYSRSVGTISRRAA